MKRTSRTRRAVDGMTAADIMAKRVVTVSPGAPLSEVERVLSENRVSGVPVVDSAGRALGVVSLRDLIDRYAEDPDARPRRGTNFYRLPTETVRRFYAMIRVSFEELGKLSDRVLEAYAGVGTVRAHAAEAAIVRRYEERNQSYLDLQLRLSSMREFERGLHK